MSCDQCFFAHHCDGIVCSYESNWASLLTLKNKKINVKCFPHAGNLLEVMLLKADLFFQHKFEIDSAFVCDAHRNLLLQKVYFSKERSKCDFCWDVRKLSAHAKADLRYITVSQAITLFEVFKVKHSYGNLICRRCRTGVSNKAEGIRENLHNDAFECLFNLESNCCLEDSADDPMEDCVVDCMEDEDLDYQPPIESSIDEEKLKQQVLALNNFLSVCGITKKVKVAKSYKNLSHRVKLRYIGLGKTIIQAMTSLIASDDADAYTLDILNHVSISEPNIVLDGNFRHVMTGIAETYNNKESWQSRREILSVVAPKISLKLMQLFIPGLTHYRFSAARLHAAKYGIGGKIERERKVVQRFDGRQVAHFIDFIVSPHVCTDLPFGEKILKLSTGIELFVPNTIRNMGVTRIVDQYLSYCKEMCSNFDPLGKSSLFTILETCKASTRKSLQGINYFAAEAGEAFDGIRKMIEEKITVNIDRDLLIENLKRARFYLKSDYKVHVKRSSQIADHCCVYALSDSKKSEFIQECDHDHDESCIECSNLTNTLKQIEQFIKETEKDEELLDRALTRFQTYRESIEAWKGHLLRSINQDLCRENLLEKLSDDEIYLNLDWAMKFLPMKSREPQSEFFGKRGISWHITVVMKTDSNVPQEDIACCDESNASDDTQSVIEDGLTDFSGEVDDGDSVIARQKTQCFKYKVFVHVFDHCTQDSETVVAIMKNVLCRIKESDPQIKKAFIRSDNAGCYHSANTLVAAKQISADTGITIKRIDFCDPQGGKGPCDRYAAVIKSNVRRYLDENHNVTNAPEFIEACHSHRGVKGVVAFDCRIEKNESTKKKKSSIKQITNYYNFQYQSDGLLVHRSWSVGPGLLIPWSQLDYDQSIPNLIPSQTHDFSHEWVQTRERLDSESMDVDDCNEQDEYFSDTYQQQKSVYECDVEEGCTAEFIKFGHYMNHIILGKHRRAVEKFSMTDTAMKMYHSKLEEIENRQIISLDMDLAELSVDESSDLSRGWALPKRKPNVEFSQKQRTYLRKKFDEGVLGAKHWKPKDVVWDMESLKENNKFYFTAREILNENQIRSYFCRLKRERQISSMQQPIDSGIIVDNDEEVDSELEVFEQELRETEMAIEENIIFENSLISAKRALESSLPLNASGTNSGMTIDHK